MKELDLGKEKVNKLLRVFAIPCIISMLINSIYNIVDQIFIGQGVGYLGNAATNVIFPLVIICNGIAQLIGNGCAASLSLKLGEKKPEEAQKMVGSAITTLFFASLFVCILGELFLPTLVHFFGCTKSVYPFAITYGRIILLGAPFMILYTGLAAFIRADGSPKYSMICLVIGAIINIILDPVFIFGFKMGVAGGALATVIGQIVSAFIALVYLKHPRSIHLTRQDLRLDRSIFEVFGNGMSSFITQMTVLAIFIVMNNVMTHYGATSKFGADIPLSVFGIVSKLNQLYISVILGLAIGSQPIIGFNYGAGEYKRVKETIRKVLKLGLAIGVLFNFAFVLFPQGLVSLFGSANDPLYLEFAIACCRIFLLISAINAVEICSGILIQSLGNVRKAISISLTRQIILFVPLCLLFSSIFGLYGALYAAPVSDALACIIVSIMLFWEYRKIGATQTSTEPTDKQSPTVSNSLCDSVVITIGREFGSGGRYLGKQLAEALQIPCYDKELIHLIAEESGFSCDYVKTNEETKTRLGNAFYNLDDQLFVAESNVIQKLYDRGSCVIVGRCADQILSDKPNVIRVFVTSSKEDKLNRAVCYYHMDSKTAWQKIQKINQQRAKYYKYYTNCDWLDIHHYDICFNVATIGIEQSVQLLTAYCKSRSDVMKKNSKS